MGKKEFLKFGCVEIEKRVAFFRKCNPYRAFKN